MIGQYAHGNEPSHHMAYLYNYVNQPWKTQFRVRQILDHFYKPDVIVNGKLRVPVANRLGLTLRLESPD